MKNRGNRPFFKEKMRTDGHSIRQVFDDKKTKFSHFSYKNVPLFLKYFYIVNSVIRGRHALAYHS
ncbi:hypothetical protein DQF64_07030 [Moraxella bovis]|nr:hypothetical protein DQF64_07030 [Moraxella bovis]